MYKSMLIPADSSKLAELAFSYPEELAARLDTKVTILHVADPRESDRLLMHQAYVDRSSDTIRRRISEVQEKLDKKSQQKTPDVSGDVVTGRAAYEILRYVREKGIDLIVMSTHGHTGIRHWAVGERGRQASASIPSSAASRPISISRERRIREVDRHHGGCPAGRFTTGGVCVARRSGTGTTGRQ
ncbi:MAG: universal stress protein [Dehalococcoidia bacterium]|nr:universal stress protein [Dehalococcoidia bacterium]